MTTLVLMRNDRTFYDVFNTQHSGFNFAAFDAMSAYFHLMIDSSKAVDDAIWEPAAHITRFI